MTATQQLPAFYLQHLRLQQVRKFAGLELADLRPGLNLFAGPNGAGKSSVVRAIRAAFLERHSSSSATDLRPEHDSSAAPSVALEFFLLGQSYRLEKSFLKKKRCDLTSGSRHWSAQEAEDHLAQLLGFGFPAKGSKPEHWGVPGLLWVEQGASPQDFKTSLGHAGQHLHAALHSQAASEQTSALAATAGDGLIGQLEQELGALIGKSGKPVGPLAQLLQALHDDQARLAALEASIADYRSQVDALAQLVQAQAEDERLRPETAWQAELARAQAHRQQAQQLQQSYQQGQQQQEHLQRQMDWLTQTLQAQATQVQRLEQRKQAQAQARDDVEQARQHLAGCRQEAERLHQALEQARQQWQQAQEAQHRARQRSELEQRWQASQKQQQVLQENWQQAQVCLQKVKQIAHDLSAITIKKTDVSRLQQLERAVHIASAQYQAAATVVAFDLPAGAAVPWQSDGAAGSWQGQGQMALDAATVVQLPGGGQLTITPAGQEAAQARQRLAHAQGQLATALTQLGVVDGDAAQVLWERQAQGQQQLALAEQALQLHAPQGMELLHTQLQQVQAQTQAYAAQWEQIPAAVADSPAWAGAQSTAQAAEQAWQQGQQQLQQAQQTLALAEQQHHIAQREYTALAEQLQQAPAQQAQDQQQLVQLQTQAAALQQSLQAQARALQAPELQLAHQDIERLQKSLAAHAQQSQARKEKIAALRAHLDAVGASGLEETAALLAATVAQQERRAKAQQRRADALQLLVQRLKAARLAAVQRLQAPLARRLQHYVRLLQPGATLELDGQLAPAHIHADAGGVGTFMGAVELLSYGSQEQLGILSRLAYADVLREAGQPTLLMLDDVLVHSDAQRLAQMKRALFDAAQRHQVLLFTCRPQDWGDAGVPIRFLP